MHVPVCWLGLSLSSRAGCEWLCKGPRTQWRAVQLLGLQLIKVLQAQNQVVAPAVLSVMAVVVNIGANFHFIHNYGFLGAPLATTASRFIYFAAAIALVTLSLTRAQPRFATAQAVAHPRAADVDEPLLAAAEGAAYDADSGDRSQQQLPDGVLAATYEPAVVDGGQGRARHNVNPRAEPLTWPPAAEERGHGVWQRHLARAVRQGLGRAAIGGYLRLAMPSAVMVGLASGFIDVTTALAGMLGPVQVRLAPTTVPWPRFAASMRVVRGAGWVGGGDGKRACRWTRTSRCSPSCTSTTSHSHSASASPRRSAWGICSARTGRSPRAPRGGVRFSWGVCRWRRARSSSPRRGGDWRSFSSTTPPCSARWAPLRSSAPQPSCLKASTRPRWCGASPCCALHSRHRTTARSPCCPVLRPRQTLPEMYANTTRPFCPEDLRRPVLQGHHDACLPVCLVIREQAGGQCRAHLEGRAAMHGGARASTW